MPVPAVGERAPDFRLSGTTGEVRLDDRLASGPVVLIFYMEDSTPTCSQQVASFQTEHPTLADLGAQVLAISSDSLEPAMSLRDATPDEKRARLA